MITESQLQHVYTKLTEAIGHEGATTLVEIFSPLARNELATRADQLALRSDFDDLRADFALVKSDFALVKSDFADLRADFAELRSDVVTEIAGLKQELTRTFTTLLVASQGALAAILGTIIALD